MFRIISLFAVLQGLAAPFAFSRIWQAMQMAMVAGLALAMIRHTFLKTHRRYR